MVAFVIALCIIVPIVELAVMIEVGTIIGVLPVVGLLILDVVVGMALLSFQGRSAWRRFNDALRSGKAPTREVIDGVLIVSGAVLLIIPGFVTDVVGLVLLVPPTRVVVRSVILRYVQSNFVVGVGTTAYSGATAAWRRRPGRAGAGAPGPQGAPPGTPPPASLPYDVDGTAVEVDDSRQQRLGS